MNAPSDKKPFLSQKLKYVIVLNGVVILLFLIVGGLIYVNLRKHDEDSGSNFMLALSQQYAARAKALLEEALFSVRSLALTFSRFEVIPRESRRRVYMDISRKFLEDNPRWIAVWIQWEPNLLDGLDARYVGNDLTGAGTETGAFAPFWTRGPQGIILEPSYDADYQDEYYTEARDLGVEIVTEPYYDEPQGVRTLMITASAPIYDSRGVFLGVVGIDYSLEELSAELGALRLFQTGFGRLISPAGVVAFHPDRNRIGKKAPEWDGPEADRIRQALQEGEPFIQPTYSEALKQVTMKSFVPFRVGRTNKHWMYGAVVPLDEFFAESNQFLQFFFLSLLVLVLLLILTMTLALDRLMKPLLQLKSSMIEFASGEANLRTRLAAKGNNEVAQLARYFNAFVESLTLIVFQTRSQMKGLEEIADNLERYMGTIGDELARVQDNLRSMRQTATAQSSSVMEVCSTVEQIAGNLKSLNQQVERQNQALATAASAVEEMVANIQNITRNVDLSMTAFTRLKSVSDQGYEKLEEVNEVIRNISVQSDGLQEANSIINNIASQTNLLAMNAAIEAAHAGEAGKGFAVVADEIRKLAEESANRSRDISQLLKTLHALSDQAVTSSTDAGAAFEAIRQSVDEVTNRQMEIRTAVEQQSVGNKQVLDGVGQLKQIAAEVALGAREMAQGSQSILKLVLSVVEYSRGIQKSIVDIEDATGQIKDTVGATLELSMQNQNAANQLGEIIRRFKV